MSYIKKFLFSPGIYWRDYFLKRFPITGVSAPNGGVRRRKLSDHVVKSFNKSERYMAFLATELPRLQSVCRHPYIMSRETLWSIAMDIIPASGGLSLEFGVYRGNSIRYFSNRHKKRKFYGFDSFEGFPDDGRPDWQSDFSVDSMPDVPKNCQLVKGYFSDTLPKFLDEQPGKVDFLHIDCDIYSSTVDVFTTLEKHKRLRPGIVCLFDELINYPGYLWNESLALFEMMERTGLGIEWIASHSNVRTVDQSFDWFDKKRTDWRYDWRQERRNGYDVRTLSRFTSAGLDYGPLDTPDYAARIRALGARFDNLSRRRSQGALFSTD